MLGLLVAFAISWLLLWLFRKEHISVLGVVPSAQRLREFVFGTLVMAILNILDTYGQTFFEGYSYVLNHDQTFMGSLNATWWTLKAALFEELIFRGVILYLLIRWTNVGIACTISAMAFGIYHWFSYDMLGGRIVPMVYVFLLTGSAGWMFAYAFAKTKSIYASFGLHFGWIIISILVFSNGPLGEQLFIPDNEGHEMAGWPTLFFFITKAVVVPGLIIWYLKKRYSNVPWEAKVREIEIDKGQGSG